MFKVIFLVKRRSDMSREEYQAYSSDKHAPIVANLPGIRKYVVNYSYPSETHDEPTYDGIVELWFDQPQDFEAALSSDAGQQALADQENFIDLSKTVVLPVQETSIL